MKTILATIMLSFFTMVLFAQSKVEQAQIKTSAQCEQCKVRIERAVLYSKGVKKATLDVPTAVLSITYDPQKTSLDNIKKIVSGVGYDADDVPADKVAYDKLPACCKKGGHAK